MNKSKAFTLIEVLLVVGLIAILAGIVILAINPNKQLGDTRNAQRRVDVNTVLNAVYQYAIDNNGSVPSAINSSYDCDGNTAHEICLATSTWCGSITNLGVLVTDYKYLTSLPRDPQASSTNGTGYFIVKSPGGVSTTTRVTVCAPSAEQGAVISVTR